jgi:hypothetical protein
VTDFKFLVNERNFYFHGTDVHEDSDIRGKGFDQVIPTEHFNLYGYGYMGMHFEQHIIHLLKNIIAWRIDMV